MTDFLETPQGRHIAYERHDGRSPGIVFLGGFKSDMRGSKAEHIAQWAIQTGQAYLRFDYSGHGESGGVFEEGCIGDWAADAMAVIDLLTQGPQLLVGSSMGGWISLLVAKRIPERVAGLVGIAAAPDFTKNGFWASFDADKRRALTEEGRVALHSDYGEPYIITRHLINEGNTQLVLESPLVLPFPVRFLQGTADKEVPVEWAMRLLEHAQSSNMSLTLVKGADHRFSTPDCLARIEAAIAEVLRG